jgi:hypothetical protein
MIAPRYPLRTTPQGRPVALVKLVAVEHVHKRLRAGISAEAVIRVDRHAHRFVGCPSDQPVALYATEARADLRRHGVFQVIHQRRTGLANACSSVIEATGVPALSVVIQPPSMASIARHRRCFIVSPPEDQTIVNCSWEVKALDGSGWGLYLRRGPKSLRLTVPCCGATLCPACSRRRRRGACARDCLSDLLNFRRVMRDQQ